MRASKRAKRWLARINVANGRIREPEEILGEGRRGALESVANERKQKEG